MLIRRSPEFKGSAVQHVKRPGKGQVKAEAQAHEFYIKKVLLKSSIRNPCGRGRFKEVCSSCSYSRPGKLPFIQSSICGRVIWREQ